jgi:hypothetical protein
VSGRPWHTPQAAEVRPRNVYLENLGIAVGLAVLIASVRLWRLIFTGYRGIEERK